MKKRIAIVGGGISGLTAAYILHRDYAGTCEFTLFEADSRLGGIIETIHSEDFTVECGPDSWVTEKPWAEELAREVGLGRAELRGGCDDRQALRQHRRDQPDAGRQRLAQRTAAQQRVRREQPARS